MIFGFNFEWDRLSFRGIEWQNRLILIINFHVFKVWRLLIVEIYLERKVRKTKGLCCLKRAKAYMKRQTWSKRYIADWHLILKNGAVWFGLVLSCRREIVYWHKVEINLKHAFLLILLRRFLAKYLCMLAVSLVSRLCFYFNTGTTTRYRLWKKLYLLLWKYWVNYSGCFIINQSGEA